MDCDAESAEGQLLDISLHSRCVCPVALLHTAAELMSSRSWCELRCGHQRELMSRHLVIGSWWQNTGMTFSGSLISSFSKVQNV